MQSDFFAKVEAFNPLGSVKDRLALGVIEAAERAGTLRPGQTVVEATSGNTGIGLAMVCAAKGYQLVVTMADSFSIERRKLMRALGAKVILTPAAERGTGMVRLAAQLAEKHGWFLARQFENPANPLARAANANISPITITLSRVASMNRPNDDTSPRARATSIQVTPEMLDDPAADRQIHWDPAQDLDLLVCHGPITLAVVEDFDRFVAKRCRHQDHVHGSDCRLEHRGCRLADHGVLRLRVRRPQLPRDL